MSDKDKPLPKPPSVPFGKKSSLEDGEKKEPLMADQMAMAMAEGKLEEFLKGNIPDSEHALKLAEMMMGMTGMMRSSLTGDPAPGKEGSSDERLPGMQPPENVVRAVRSGDINSVMEALAREHAKRTGNSITDTPHEDKSSISPSSAEPAIDKEVIDDLIKIASDNGLSLDWLFLRALKRYVEEYRKTGNL